MAPNTPGARQCLSRSMKLFKAGVPTERAGKYWRREQQVDGMKDGGGDFLGKVGISLSE